MKVFDRPFFKKVAGFGAAPRYSAFFGSFLRLLAQKRTERIFSMLAVLNFLPAFFFDTAGAEEIASHSEAVHKKETPRKFRACGRDLGLCPKSPPPFEKGGRKLSSVATVW
ncbi:MAG: hypothetical protein IJW70_02660 [Clostridia bacterium]|nr:hypothetical protein [Clostridia bacterium]